MTTYLDTAKQYLNTVTQHLPSKEIVAPFAVPAAIATLKSYSWPTVAVISASTGYASLAAEAYGPNRLVNPMYKTALNAAFNCASFIGLYLASTLVGARFNFKVLTPAAWRTLTVLNILGQTAVSFWMNNQSVKLEELMSLSKEQLTQLHENCTKNKSAFAAFSDVNKVILNELFDHHSLEKIKITVKKDDVEEERYPELNDEVFKRASYQDLRNLHDFQLTDANEKAKTVRDLFSGADNELALLFAFNKVRLIDQETLRKNIELLKVQIQQHYQANPEYKNEIDLMLASASLATQLDCWNVNPSVPFFLGTVNLDSITGDDAKTLAAHLPWYLFTYEEQTKINEKLKTFTYSIKYMHPKTAEEVAQLSDDQVKEYHAHYAEANISHSISKALIAKFGESGLDTSVINPKPQRPLSNVMWDYLPSFLR